MDLRGYFERVGANIKANPWKWLGGLALVLAQKLFEHRALLWANNRVDEGASIVVPYIRDILMTVVAHPWVSVFVLLASYSILMVAIAHVSAWRSQEVPLQSANATDNADPSDSLELLSPDRVGVHIQAFHQPETGIDGLLLSILNETTTMLKSCIGRVNRARSLDSKRSTFIDGLSASTLLHPFGDVPHNDESKPQWLVRISNDKARLEIGATNGEGGLRWPPREPLQILQVWLLTISIEVEGQTQHEFVFRMEWSRQSNTLKVRLP